MNLKVILAIIIVLFCISGCTVAPETIGTDKTDTLQTDCPTIPKATETGDMPQTDSTKDIQNGLDTYYEFLNGNISVSDKNDNVYDINDFFMEDENNRFTFFDSNHNGISELHLSSPRYYVILECVNDELKTIYDGTGYETLLNNGTILYTRYGGAPDHISYKYIELDSDNNIFETTFEEYNGDMEDDYDYFLIDGEEVSKSEFDTIAEKYLSIGSDGIIWSDYGTFLDENAN